MTQRIDVDQVRHIAHLARLALTDEECRRYASQLEAILDYVEQLMQVDVEGIEPTAHPLPINNVYAADEPRATLSRESALANAPAQQDGFFLVPRVPGQEGGA
jgi:aspartyl-tRNA(Asn)/glutamyl-tRNA(Gln) amidotransferase subunit C